MSGHSKWATIKRAKEVTDAKRGNIFTKLARAITVAAKHGGDPNMNPSLRVAMDKAREANMPKDNIERAIKKGTGEDQSAALEEILYEGFGPDGVGILVETVTDNKNRTASEVRHLFQKHGGSMGLANSVLWQFERKGIFFIDTPHTDDTELNLIEEGVADFNQTENGYVCFTAPEQVHAVAKKLADLKLVTKDLTLSFIPKETIKTNNASLLSLIDELENNDDISTVITNADMSL